MESKCQALTSRREAFGFFRDFREAEEVAVGLAMQLREYIAFRKLTNSPPLQPGARVARAG
jgi:hypothetical protein